MKITLLLVFIVLTVDVIGFEVVSSNAVPLGILLPYNSAMVPSTKLCCFMNSGYELASLEFTYNGPTSAWVSTTTISSCRNAELSMDILITPNLYASVNDQVAKIFTTIEASSYGMIWINVDAQPTFKPSCNFLAQMVNGISQKGKTVGIRSSKQSWDVLFGTEGCADLLKRPLWNNATQVFGGWTRNTRVTLNGTQSICGSSMSVYS